MKTIFENSNILVIDKPSGLVVNKSETSPDNTLQDLLIENYSFDYDPNSDSPFLNRTGIVHRLDKDTSGIIVIAKNEETFTFLQEQFKLRQVEKEYLAIIYGKLPDEELIVDAPISRDRRNRMRYAISKDGKTASTRFVNALTFDLQDTPVSLIHCFPITGRTHQIRVHLKALGTPVLGDPIYGGKRQFKWAINQVGITRLLLHAHKLSLRISRDDSEYSQYTSDLSGEFESIIPKEYKL